MLALAFFALSVTVFGCAGWGARVRPERPPREAVADYPTAHCLPRCNAWNKTVADNMDDWIGAVAPARRGLREQRDDPLHPAEEEERPAPPRGRLLDNV